MSHLKERNEKICLNCKAQLSGPFCHICGQENIEPKESVWHLLTHIFKDITHFDGKFFASVGLLTSRPGFLPREYMLGRRASYLNPVRMYIFTSAIFFLIFFSFFHIEDKTFDKSIIIEGKTIDEIRSLSADSLQLFTAKINNGRSVPHEGLERYFDSIKNTEGFHLTNRRYKSRQEYDSFLNYGIKKHNWLQRRLIYKEIEANKKYHNNISLFISSLFSNFLHSFPQMLFISLPFFAIFLKLLYRRKKDYYYVSHSIFSVYFYVFVFIAMLLIFGLGKVKYALHLEWLGFLQTFLVIVIFFYLYKAMHNFYQQGHAITIVKFLTLLILSAVLIAVLFFVFILYSFMKI